MCVRETTRRGHPTARDVSAWNYHHIPHPWSQNLLFLPHLSSTMWRGMSAVLAISMHQNVMLWPNDSPINSTRPPRHWCIESSRVEWWLYLIVNALWKGTAVKPRCTKVKIGTVALDPSSRLSNSSDHCTVVYSVSQKNPPCGFLTFFPKRMGIFRPPGTLVSKAFCFSRDVFF